MKLSIVIPAYNEAEAIGAIVTRCLAARETIMARSSVDDVEIIVVSDGSTDRTAEIAAGFGDVRLIVFEHNRGYGAAIKKGFEVSTGDLVGFLDADGTCEPNFFATLCTTIIDQNASVVIGSRMGPESRMPAIRRLGNRIYAVILSALSNRVVTDTASGMRVIRRTALDSLYPLPDGLHFTPAMSARVLMDDRLTIVERPMPYEERIGESKLNVVSDGLRFLNIILQMSLMWKPAKMFLVTAAICLGVMLLLASHPIEMWLRLGHLNEDMIYRLLFCSLAGMIGVTLLSAGVVSDHLQRLLEARGEPQTFLAAILDRAFSFRGLCVASLLGTPALVWLVGPGLWTRVTEGFVSQHWSRAVLAGMIAFALAQLLITVLITNLFRFHTTRKMEQVGRRSTGHVSAKTADVGSVARPGPSDSAPDRVPAPVGHG